SRALAVSLLALQREGALGARLQARRARAPLAAPRSARGARRVDDRAEVGPRAAARRADDQRLDAHHRRPGGALPGPAALPAGPGRARAGARPRGVLR